MRAEESSSSGSGSESDPSPPRSVPKNEQLLLRVKEEPKEPTLPFPEGQILIVFDSDSDVDENASIDGAPKKRRDGENVLAESVQSSGENASMMQVELRVEGQGSITREDDEETISKGSIDRLHCHDVACVTGAVSVETAPIQEEAKDSGKQPQSSEGDVHQGEISEDMVPGEPSHENTDNSAVVGVGLNDNPSFDQSHDDL